MCRLFGSLGSADFRPYDLLVDADRSLLRQANHSPEEAQNDGWGIAWYPDPDGTPRIEKGVLGAYTDEEREMYLAAAHLAKGPLVFGHLRHASNPLHLPPEALHGLVNSQPFVYENYLFAHNGMIPLPRETQALLGEFAAKVEGVNDSEVLFWLLVKNTEMTGDPVDRLSTDHRRSHSGLGAERAAGQVPLLGSERPLFAGPRRAVGLLPLERRARHEFLLRAGPLLSDDLSAARVRDRSWGASRSMDRADLGIRSPTGRSSMPRSMTAT